MRAPRAAVLALLPGVALGEEPGAAGGAYARVREVHAYVRWRDLETYDRWGEVPGPDTLAKELRRRGFAVAPEETDDSGEKWGAWHRAQCEAGATFVHLGTVRAHAGAFTSVRMSSVAGFYEHLDGHLGELLARCDGVPEGTAFDLTAVDARFEELLDVEDRIETRFGELVDLAVQRCGVDCDQHLNEFRYRGTDWAALTPAQREEVEKAYKERTRRNEEAAAEIEAARGKLRGEIEELARRELDSTAVFREGPEEGPKALPPGEPRAPPPDEPAVPADVVFEEVAAAEPMR